MTWLVVAFRQPMLSQEPLSQAIDAAGVSVSDDDLQLLSRLLDAGGGLMPMFLMDAQWAMAPRWAWTEDRQMAKRFGRKAEAADAARKQSSAWFFRVCLAFEDAVGGLSYERTS